MALLDRIKFDSDSADVLVWKHPSENLRLGSALIVSQSQEALFVRSGRVLDVFGPGRHTLSTANLPILGKLVNLPYGGNTPFTAEVWFTERTAKRNLKWGTPRPIPILDPLLGYLVSVRAFGRWGVRIDDSRKFVGELVGTLSRSRTDDVYEYFIGEISQKLSNALTQLFTHEGESIVSVNGKLNSLSAQVLEEVSAEFNRFGIEVVNFNVERINIPEEDMRQIQSVLVKKMELQQLGNVSVGAGYTASRTFDVLESAATNDGVAGSLLAGGLGLGAGLGAGTTIGAQLGRALDVQVTSDPATRLASLKQLADAGLITAEEYASKRKEIIDAL